jgi:Tfp pilus assembly protein PilF
MSVLEPRWRLTRPASAKEVLMRYSPVALALSAVVALSASSGQSVDAQPMDPRAASLEAIGRGALAAGDTNQATDAFEAALAVDPGAARLVLDLAETARRDGLQGKALHYYRVVLERDPQDLAAIAGEGEALAEKGATEKAQRNLAQLENLCGKGCAQSRELAAAIAKGPAPQAGAQVVSADAPKPKDPVSTN